MVRIDPAKYSTAADAYDTIAQQALDYAIEARSALSGTGGIAGTDPGGESFSESYDAMAAAAMQTLYDIAVASRGLDRSLMASGGTHAQANANAEGIVYDAGSAFVLRPAIAETSVAPPPSAFGGRPDTMVQGLDSAAVWVWDQILNFIGTLFPDGDPDKLEEAGRAWRGILSDIGSLRTSIRLADNSLAGIDSGEIAAITQKVDDFADGLTTFLSADEGIGQIDDICKEYAQTIRDTLEETRNMLIQLVIEVVAGAGLSFALSFVTFGAAGVAGAAAITARVIAIGGRIGALVTKCVGVATRLAARLRAIVPGLVRAGQNFPRLTRAGIEIVSGTGASVIAETVQGSNANYGAAALSGLAGSSLTAAIVAPFGKAGERFVVQALANGAGGAGGTVVDLAVRGEEITGAAIAMGTGLGVAGSARLPGRRGGAAGGGSNSGGGVHVNDYDGPSGTGDAANASGGDGGGAPRTDFDGPTGQGGDIGGGGSDGGAAPSNHGDAPAATDVHVTPEGSGSGGDGGSSAGDGGSSSGGDGSSSGGDSSSAPETTSTPDSTSTPDNSADASSTGDGPASSGTDGGSSTPDPAPTSQGTGGDSSGLGGGAGDSAPTGTGTGGAGDSAPTGTSTPVDGGTSSEGGSSSSNGDSTAPTDIDLDTTPPTDVDLDVDPTADGTGADADGTGADADGTGADADGADPTTDGNGADADDAAAHTPADQDSTPADQPRREWDGPAPTHDQHGRQYLQTDDGRRTLEGDPDNTYRDRTGRLHDADTHHFATDTNKPETDLPVDRAVRGDAEDFRLDPDAQADHQARVDERTDLQNESRDASERVDDLAREADIDPADLNGRSEDVDETIRDLVDDGHLSERDADRIRAALDDERKAADALRGGSERLGDQAAGAVSAARGETTLIAPGGAGSGQFDHVTITGNPEPTLHVYEAKGGNSSLGYRTVDGVRAEQGTTAYLDDIAQRDRRLQESLDAYMQSPDADPNVVEAIRNGTLDVRYELVEARPNGDIRVTEFQIDPDRVRVPGRVDGDATVTPDASTNRPVVAGGGAAVTPDASVRTPDAAVHTPAGGADAGAAAHTPDAGTTTTPDAGEAAPHAADTAADAATDATTADATPTADPATADPAAADPVDGADPASAAGDDGSGSAADPTAADPSTSTGGVPGREYTLSDGSTYTTQWAPEQVDSMRSAYAELEGHVTASGRTMDDLVDLIHTPTSSLSPADVQFLHDLRRLVQVDGSTVFQRVIAPGEDLSRISGSYPYGLDSFRGFVTRLQDVTHFGNAQDVFTGLRLDYQNSQFHSLLDGPIQMIRYQTATAPEIPFNDRLLGAPSSYNDPAPFTGNGFTSSGIPTPDGNVVPELYAPTGTVAQPGAEMWEVTTTGTYRLLAVLDDTQTWLQVRA
ncbi:WXG100-like domain-containing protein [Microbacterium maritypicum]